MHDIMSQRRFIGTVKRGGGVRSQTVVFLKHKTPIYIYLDVTNKYLKKCNSQTDTVKITRKRLKITIGLNLLVINS